MKFKIILYNILFVLVTMCIYLAMYTKLNNIDFVLKAIGILSLLLFVIIIFSWYQYTHSLLNLFMFFCLFLIIFNLGQFIVYFLNGGDFQIFAPYINSLTTFSDKIMYKASIISYYSIICLHIGGLIAYNKNKIINKNVRYVNETYCKYIGYMLIIISLIPTFIYDYTYLMQGLSSGYKVSSLDINYGLFDDFARLFKVALFFLMLGFRSNKKISKLFYIFFLFYSIFKIWATGQRGYEFIFIIIITYLYYEYIANFNLKKVLMIFFITMILFSLMNSVVYVRDTTNKVSFERVINNIVSKNIITEVFAEFGSTFYTTELIVNEVPKTYDFSYGKEYLSSFLSILPNINGLNNYLININIIHKLLRTSEIGLGGSFIGEAYYNFSIGIFLFMFLVGYYLYKMIGLRFDKNNSINLFKVGIILAFYQNAIWLCRDSIMSLPRKCLIEIGLPILLYNFIKYLSKNKIIFKYKEHI